MVKIISFLFLLQFLSSVGYSQLRELSAGDTTNPNVFDDNGIRKISFFKANEGYLAFQDYIGYTTDSGHTVTRKYISYGNVDFGNYSVNLTFGFGIEGVKAFSRDTVIVYGDYGFVPSILYSTDGANTFRLIYQSGLNFQRYYTMTDMLFPTNSNVGYAVEADRIIKTVDRGKTWFQVLSKPNEFFDGLIGTTDDDVLAFNDNEILQTSSGGAVWTTVNLPAGQSFVNCDFLTPNKGWVEMYQNGTYYLYSTSDGASTWTPKRNWGARDNGINHMKFRNDSTGYATSFYDVYKTTDTGNTWEPLPRDNTFSYLGNSLSGLFFWNDAQFWAGGAYAFLELTTNSGGTTLPKAFFTLDTTGLAATGLVHLNNFSKHSYTFKWYRNDTLIGTTYNLTYTHDIHNPVDTVKLVVTKGTTSDSAIIIQYYTLPPPPPIPTITSFTPTTGIIGTVVTITGTNLNGATAVSFGGRAAKSFFIQSSTTIKATVDSGATGSVSVTTPYGTATKDTFRFIPPPSITSFTPTSADAGTTITITGNNFNGVTAVNFGVVPAVSFTIVNNNTITAIVGSGGTGNISVTGPGGTALAPGFTYTSKVPVIITFSPTSGAVNSQVIITGNNFDPVAANDVVYFGAVKATVTAASATSLTVIVPVGATYRTISVTTNRLTAFSAMPFTVTFAGDGKLDSSSFEARKDFAVAGSPSDIIMLDVDGDGKADVVSPDYDLNTVSVLKNASSPGTVTLSPHLEPTVGAHVRGWAYGDFDGDGKPDVAIVNYNGGVVSVSKNTSAGGTVSFGPKQDYGVRAYPWDVIVDDLDGDGRPDLIVAIEGNGNDVSHKLCVLRNTSYGGNISFAPEVEFLTSGVPLNVATADMDGDGKHDLVVSSGSAFPISILRNTSIPGFINFASSADFFQGSTYTSAVIADFDGDGKPDIAAASLANHSIAFALNTSTPGVISMGAAQEYPGGLNLATRIVVTDLNGDGKPDAVFENLDSTTVSAYKNISTVGTLSFAPRINFSKFKAAYGSLDVGDIDGDGRPDIAVGNFGTQIISILRNAAPALVPVSICPGSTSTSITSDVKGTLYQWQENTGSGFVNITDGGSFSGTNQPVLNISSLTSSWNNYQFRCLANGNNGVPFQLNFTPNVSPSVKIATRDSVICTGNTATFTAVPTNAGTSPTYVWRVNGVVVSTNSTYISATLNNNDHVQVTVKSIVPCALPDTATNLIIMSVGAPSLTPLVTLVASDSVVCYGSPVTLTATVVNGGTNPIYHWQINGLNSGATGPVVTFSQLSPPGSAIKVIVESNASCLVTNVGTSNTVVVTINAQTVPEITIAASANNVCPLTPITFTATTTNAGSTPTYQWRKNTNRVGTNSSTYSDNTLVNGDLIYCDLTSSATCEITNANSSNRITMVMNGTFTPTITLAGTTTVNQGQSTTITSTSTNGGTTPALQWQDSTQSHNWANIAGATNASINYTPGTTGDKLRCVLTSNSNCASPGTVNSAAIVFTVNKPTAINPVPAMSYGIHLYPNPAHGILMIDTLKISDRWEDLYIVSADGSKVLISQNIKNQTTVKVDVQQLGFGFYVAVIRRENGETAYLKFLKM